MNNLKKILNELKLSQSKVAIKAAVPQPSFNMIVNGKLAPCPAWRRRISEALQISEDELFPEYKKEVIK